MTSGWVGRVRDCWPVRLAVATQGREPIAALSAAGPAAVGREPGLDGHQQKRDSTLSEGGTRVPYPQGSPGRNFREPYIQDHTHHQREEKIPRHNTQGSLPICYNWRWVQAPELFGDLVTPVTSQGANEETGQRRRKGLCPSIFRSKATTFRSRDLTLGCQPFSP